MIACPKKTKLLVPVAEPKVNLASSGAPMYAITQSKMADERLNNREEHKEIERTRDTCKKDLWKPMGRGNQIRSGAN